MLQQELLLQSNLRSDIEMDIGLLRRLGVQLIQQSNLETLHEQIVDAAVIIMRSHFASLQMLYPDGENGGKLRLLAYRGFKPEAAIFWKWVTADAAGSTCGKALQEQKRVIAGDIEQCDYIKDTEHLKMFRLTGIASCQSTPLFSRKGELIGVISTHWNRPHSPSWHQLHLLDLLARHAADLIEHKQREEMARVN